MCRILDQLAKNIDVQMKLRDEIIRARNNQDGSDFDYDALMALPYLDAVVRETLRLYPPISILARTYAFSYSLVHSLILTDLSFLQCRTQEDTVLPIEFPVLAADGKTRLKEIPVEKGQRILTSLFAANRNKEVWGEDAEEWKPDRWLHSDHPSKSEARLPGVYASMYVFSHRLIKDIT